jgi:chemotaxis protein methyltransferase CheR
MSNVPPVASAESPLQIDRTALEGLAALLLEKVGLKITPDGYYGLRLAMQARMPALGLSDGQEYVRRLRQLAGETELRGLLPLVTVGKTEFFRDSRQFKALEQTLMPQMLTRARRANRQVEIWSAGCATGEEPHSLGMVAVEKGAMGGEVDIWATDLNPAAVEFAKEGLYPVRRMIGVSEERLQRFFTLTDGGYQVIPAVREMIHFEGHNLAAPVFPHVLPATKDLILCRNVIIYFDQPTIRSLMDRFLDALRPGGVLLLGYSESLFRITSKFEMFEVDGTFAYRRPWPVENAPPPPRPSAPPPPPSSPRPMSSVLPRRPTTGTFRIPLPSPSAQKPTPRPAEVHRSPVERLDDVVRLIEKGDFPQAMLAVRRLTDDHPDDLAALLTLGNVHALMGNADESRECFSRALKAEPLCVEARIYLGLAMLQEGKLSDARAELQKALFLEPTLSLGHYLLAQVHEQQGDREAARRSYRNAVAQRRFGQRVLLGHYPELPGSTDAIAQAAQYRLAALSES